MPLVTTTEMFKKAYAGHYAIGAFNINNMEIVGCYRRSSGPSIPDYSSGFGRCQKIRQAELSETSR